MYGGASITNDLVFTTTWDGTVWALDARHRGGRLEGAAAGWVDRARLDLGRHRAVGRRHQERQRARGWRSSRSGSTADGRPAGGSTTARRSAVVRPAARAKRKSLQNCLQQRPAPGRRRRAHATVRSRMAVKTGNSRLSRRAAAEHSPVAAARAAAVPHRATPAVAVRDRVPRRREALRRRRRRPRRGDLLDRPRRVRLPRRPDRLRQVHLHPAADEGARAEPRARSRSPAATLARDAALARAVPAPQHRRRLPGLQAAAEPDRATTTSPTRSR